jgi:hypothetical protein
MTICGFLEPPLRKRINDFLIFDFEKDKKYIINFAIEKCIYCTKQKSMPNSIINNNQNKYGTRISRFIAMFVVISIIFNLFGYIFLYFGMQNFIKKEIRNYISNNAILSELEQIIVPIYYLTSSTSDFQLLEEDEFKYQGKMYDVVKTENNGSYITFYCINDKKEEELNNNIVKDFSNNIKDIIIKSIKVFSPDLIYIIQNKFINLIVSDFIHHSNNFYLLNGFFNIIIPPPRIY